MTSRIAILLVALSSGCAAESAARPPAPYGSPVRGARRGAWQQFCEQAWNITQANTIAMARGADGWELLGMYNGVLCFKRPAGEAPAEARPPAPAEPNYVPTIRDMGF